MQQLNLPPYPFRFRKTNGQDEIFDKTRRRYVSLTAEEWVRQHFLMYLHLHLGYPLSTMAVEKSIKVNRMPRRFDIVVYIRSGKPGMLVECKAPEIELTQDVLDQAGRYNLSLNVPYIIITNGMKHLCCRFDEQERSWKFLEMIPRYSDL